MRESDERLLAFSRHVACTVAGFWVASWSVCLLEAFVSSHFEVAKITRLGLASKKGRWGLWSVSSSFIMLTQRCVRFLQIASKLGKVRSLEAILDFIRRSVMQKGGGDIRGGKKVLPQPTSLARNPVSGTVLTSAGGRASFPNFEISSRRSRAWGFGSPNPHCRSVPRHSPIQIRRCVLLPTALPQTNIPVPFFLFRRHSASLVQ